MSSTRAGISPLAAVLGGLLLFSAGWWAGGRWRDSRTAPDGEVVAVTPAEAYPADADLPLDTPDMPPQAPVTVAEEGSGASTPEAGRRARIALVIDDLGRSVGDLSILGALGVPLSYAVLPFEARTPEVVAEINRRGWEMLCHLPMEPSSGADPGPGALTSEMSGSELAAATRAALAAVPGAVGVNNHMGSTLSANPTSMGSILGVVGDEGLFYLDSRTSAETVAYRTAVERGIPAAERQVFLDPDPSAAAIEEQFDRLLKVATERGAAIAIGHPHRSTLDVLAYRVPDALARGYEFVPVSFLVDRPGPTVE